VTALESVSQKLWEMAAQMVEKRKEDPLQWASYTYPALTAFGDVIMAWRLLDMAAIAHPASLKKGKKNDFYRGKVLQATYFCDITLPHTLATLATCRRRGREIVEIEDNAF
jgi:hypothetical protein